MSENQDPTAHEVQPPPVRVSLSLDRNYRNLPLANKTPLHQAPEFEIPQPEVPQPEVPQPEFLAPQGDNIQNQTVPDVPGDAEIAADFGSRMSLGMTWYIVILLIFELHVLLNIAIDGRGPVLLVF